MKREIEELEKVLKEFDRETDFVFFWLLMSAVVMFHAIIYWLGGFETHI